MRTDPQKQIRTLCNAFVDMQRYGLHKATSAVLLSAQMSFALSCHHKDRTSLHFEGPAEHVLLPSIISIRAWQKQMGMQHRLTVKCEENDK